MIVTGTITLYGAREAAVYDIDLSTGGSEIRVDKDGATEATVYAVFHKRDDTGAYTTHTAVSVLVNWDNLHYFTYENVSRVDLSAYLDSTSIKGVTVTLYDDDEQTKILAQKRFPVVYPQEVTMPLSLKLNGGDTYIPLSSNGQFSEGQDIAFSLWRGEKQVAGYIKVYTKFISYTGRDMETSDLAVSATSPLSFKSSFNSYVTILRYPVESLRVQYWDSITPKEEALESTFMVKYDVGIPFPRTEEWATGNTYKNGHYLMNPDNGQLYMWIWPLDGNTTTAPWTYVANGSEPKKWSQYTVEALLATKILLAKHALVGGAVFFDDYMMSQDGKDAAGNDSSDYTQYPDNFTPNTMINFKTGDSRFRIGEFSGFIRMEPRVITRYTSDNPDLTFTEDYYQINLTNLRRGGFIVIDMSDNSYVGDGLRLPTGLEYAGAMVTVINRWAAKVFKIVPYKEALPSGYAGWNYEDGRRMSTFGREIDGVKLGGVSTIGASRIAEFIATPCWPDAEENGEKYAGNVVWVLKNSQEFSVKDYTEPTSRWAENKVYGT